MGLAIKVQRHQKSAGSIESFRIRLVRVLFRLICHYGSHETSAQPGGLLIEPYKQLEKKAMERVKSNTRIQQSAFALIAIGQGKNRRYLLQWNANWSRFNLIGGKVDNEKGDNNSFQCIIERELEEELGIVCPDEFTVKREVAQLKMQQFSLREHRVKNYHFAIFEVDIFPALPLDHKQPHYFARWLSTGRENAFVTRSEIENLCTTAGRPISATTRYIIRELEGRLSASSTAV